MSQKPKSVAIFTCDGASVEMAASRCAHCPAPIEVPNMRRLTDHADICRLCNKLVCINCAGKPCAPWEKTISRMEEESYRKEQFLKSMGFY